MSAEDECPEHSARVAEYETVVRQLREVERRAARALDAYGRRRGRGPNLADLKLLERLHERADWLWTVIRARKQGAFR